MQRYSEVAQSAPSPHTPLSPIGATHAERADVPLALARARENVALSVRQLVEHAVQVQSKIESEMDGLTRVGRASTVQLAQELQEARDRCGAYELAIQTKDREVDEMRAQLKRLNAEVEAARREAAKERGDKNSVQKVLEQRASLVAAELASQEQSHASAMQQLSTSHSASFDALKQQHELEKAKAVEEMVKREEQLKVEMDQLKAELDKERRKAKSTAQRQDGEAQRLQQSVDELLRAREASERQARKEVDNARQARQSVEARCRTLAGALEATKLNAAKEVREMRDELDATLARLAALEARHSKPRKLAVTFPADGSAPVLRRRASVVGAADGLSAEEARIQLLTSQNRTAKRSLADNGAVYQ